MKKLIVKNINDRNYTLINLENKKEYNFTLTFYGIDKIKEGTIFYFHKELLDPEYSEYSTEYYFGPIDEVYGREIKCKNDIDLICVEINNEKTFLKRFFG